MNEYTNLTRILKELEEIVQRENKRHQMDQHLGYSMLGLLEDEIIPQLRNELDWEPSDDELLGEPPTTMQEMHDYGWKQHVAMHS